MAHTAIRLGYLSISGGGGGGGAGYEEYADLASFPPVGQSGVIYLAVDTKKIYRWNSVAYQEISPSEVTSVNTQVGDVVLDKADVGLDQVDNTSDLDKPISDDTQDALDALEDRIVPIEDRAEVVTVYAYENNAQVYADGQPGVKDPSALIRDGWYFKNSIAGQKINWYYFDGTSQGTVTLGDLKSSYAVMTFDAVSGAASPIIAIYTFPTGTGDVIPGFAHSRIVYDGPMTPTPVVGKQYLVYAGENPPVHPELPRINLALIPGLSIGDKLPTEQILTISFGSSSGAAVNSVQYMVETLGLFSDPVKHEMDLRIRQASQLDLTSHVTNTSNPHSVTKDQVGLGNVDNTSDLDKPISTATQTALNGKQDALGFTPENVANKSTDTSLGISDTLYPTQKAVKTYVDSGLSTKINSTEKGAPNGVAPLNSLTKIDATYLPSYVDDVEEYANLAAFPPTGETGKIYIALDTNLCYRWSGSVYVEISPAPVLSVNGQTNVVVLDSDDLANQQAVTAYWDIADGSTIKAHLDELAARREAQNTLTSEPTGFATRDESTTSFSDSGPDRTFTIAPTGASFEFYVKGIKFVKTSAETLQIPNLAGNHFIYYNASGVLSSTQVASSVLFRENALLAIVYWNTDTNTHSYFAEERHGLTMDGETHSYLHTVFGAQYLSGLALQGFSVNGDGSLAAHAQFTADEGTIRDEDLLLTLPAQIQIPVLYRQGSLWRKKAADSFPIIYSGTAGYAGASGRLPYNQLLSGSWQLTEIANNAFVLVHLFGTNDKETPIIAIQGIAEYGNVTAARLAASSEITSLSGLPFAEFVALGSVVFQSANTFTNTPKAATVSVNGGNYVDFRGTQLYTPAGVATSHGLLSGLSNDDHIQYHTDARGDVRYYTKAQVDALIGAGGSPGDINEKSYSFSNSQVVPESITDFAFSNATVRSFNAIVSVKIDADSDLYEVFDLHGIQKGSEWDLSISSSGDSTGIMFSITNSGQLQYTSENYTGFVSGTMKFRAITTSA
jgi:hypothetical protein